MPFHYVDTYGAGFAAAGAPLHPYGDKAAWASFNEATGIVALAMWESGFKRVGDEYIFDSFRANTSDAWYNNLSPRRRERNMLRRNLLRDLRPPGHFRAFITIRLHLGDFEEVGHSMVVEGLELKLIDLNAATCECRARVVRPSPQEFGEALLDIRNRYPPRVGP